MTGPVVWQPVHEALDRWSKAGLKAPFWLRDDDAVEPSAALDRLIAIAAPFRVPVGLAVVPCPTGKPLAERLRNEPYVVPVVHGWAHRNHAPEGEKKQEFGLHRPLHEMQEDLTRGLAKMRALYASRLVPMFVPPWNRIAPPAVNILRSIGYTAISTFGPAPAVSAGHSLPELNTHVDIIDFRGTRSCRDPGLLAGSIAATLMHSLDHGRYAVGILSHHLVHDKAAFQFLEDLLLVTHRHLWLSPADLIERRVGFV
jgi:hypothetical protein